ncbi:VOC family protein [Pseudogemmobacter humi]|uniref:27 kDa antigen Cfp30B n=1 Tax=Pseudogemmobacter humi TaxID=2483812 RepID=A0A3P5XVD6_9RHOB|nr:VOC family protein [Pseudogemmobacter humi]VDC33150.1 27 kDa antigen Cfp30B [Pseudogemmobacter humi]
MSCHGSPCWYELTTRDTDAARAFYGPLLGWTFRDAGMEGFDYGLALKDGAMVAGLMDPGEPMPEFWMTCFAVERCDDAVAQAEALGAQIHRAPEDIPGTGRFAILADPQGAVFGLLAPQDQQAGEAFDQQKPGHGNWHELHSTDPVAGFAFYAALLGWSASDAMDMGADGKYQLFARQGRDIGGMMGMPGMEGAPPFWLPYFGVESAGAARARILELGGTVLHGPAEVPGGAWITMATDPRGARFAVVGGE